MHSHPCFKTEGTILADAHLETTVQGVEQLDTSGKNKKHLTFWKEKQPFGILITDALSKSYQFRGGYYNHVKTDETSA